MLIADMKNIGAVHNGALSIGEVYYGEQLVWRKGKGFNTPYSREVEYLLAKDTDTYIVTGFKIKDLTKYDFEIKGWCGLGATMLFGSRDNATSGNTNQVAMIHGANGNYQYRIMTGSSSVASITANNTNPHIFKWVGNEKTLYYDDAKYVINDTAKVNASKIDSQYELALFGCNSGGFVDNTGKDRCIYYFKIWYEDELIADYIPVIDNNGIPCFFDRVTEKLVRCSGNGKFEFAEKEQK